MALSSLFYGMEAYLDGDVEINNNVTTPEDDAVAAADQSAEIASDVADANVGAKDSEVQAQMLIQMSKLYTHVKTYGIDRTFVSLYNQNGELDRMCGIRFPSCESMPATGNPYSQYSSRFIAAMEDGNKGIWASIKKFFATIWHWLKTTAQTVWQKIKSLFGVKIKECDKVILEFDKKCGMLDEIQVKGLFTVDRLSGAAKSLDSLINSLNNDGFIGSLALLYQYTDSVKKQMADGNHSGTDNTINEITSLVKGELTERINNNIKLLQDLISSSSFGIGSDESKTMSGKEIITRAKEIIEHTKKSQTNGFEALFKFWNEEAEKLLKEANSFIAAIDPMKGGAGDSSETVAAQEAANAMITLAKNMQERLEKLQKTSMKGLDVVSTVIDELKRIMNTYKNK